MTYSMDHVHLRLHGTLGNNTTGVDQWSVGLKIPRPEGSVTGAQMTAFLAAVSGAASALHGSTAMKVGSTIFLKRLTAAFIGLDGKYVGGGAQPTTVYDYATPVAGNGAVVMPWSTCNVISLRTAVTRGRGSNGRVYYPSTAQALDAATGGFIPASMASVASTFKTFLDAVNAAATTELPSSTHKVSVMSNLGGGTTNQVTSIRVGVRPDRQERRENGVAENYQTAVIALTASDAAALAEDSWDSGVARRRD